MLRRCTEPGALPTNRYRQEMLGPSLRRALDQHVACLADFGRKPRAQRRLALLAQLSRTLPHRVACDLRHARGRRAGPRGVRKHVQEGQPAFVDEIERAREHLVGLGREAGDDVGAEHDVRAQPAHLVAKRDRIGARMPALHALQDRDRRPPAATDADAASAAHRWRSTSSRSRSASIESIDDSRSRLHSGTCFRICFTSAPSLGVHRADRRHSS